MNTQKLIISPFAGLLAALVLAPSAAAQYAIPWHTIDAGGQTFSLGPNYVLGATIGQPDAGPATPMTGGDFQLVGGFWPVTTILDACQPCDTNCDGSVNSFDIQSFVDVLTGGGTPCSSCAADANDDGSVNGFDIQGFVDCLTG